jgi:dihydrodipicolinate reductase
MSVGVLVNGFSGKTGQVALHAIAGDNDLHLVGQTRRGDDLAAAIQRAKPDVGWASWI